MFIREAFFGMGPLFFDFFVDLHHVVEDHFYSGRKDGLVVLADGRDTFEDQDEDLGGGFLEVGVVDVFVVDYCGHHLLDEFEVLFEELGLGVGDVGEGGEHVVAVLVGVFLDET